MKQLDGDMSPPAKIVIFRLGLTHVTTPTQHMSKRDKKRRLSLAELEKIGSGIF